MYLDSERVEQDLNAHVDVSVLTPENRVLRHSEDVVLVRAGAAVARNGVVSHEPLVHVYIQGNQYPVLSRFRENAR